MFGSRGVPGAPREKHNHAFYEGRYHQGTYLDVADSSIWILHYAFFLLNFKLFYILLFFRGAFN